MNKKTETHKTEIKKRKKERNTCTMYGPYKRRCIECRKSQKYLQHWLSKKNISKKNNNKMGIRYWNKYVKCDKKAVTSL
jgi:hypothetical protein